MHPESRRVRDIEENLGRLFRPATSEEAAEFLTRLRSYLDAADGALDSRSIVKAPACGFVVRPQGFEP
jgi:hypothetical protein